MMQIPLQRAYPASQLIVWPWSVADVAVEGAAPLKNSSVTRNSAKQCRIYLPTSHHTLATWTTLWLRRRRDGDACTDLSVPSPFSNARRSTSSHLVIWSRTREKSKVENNFAITRCLPLPRCRHTSAAHSWPAQATGTDLAPRPQATAIPRFHCSHSGRYCRRDD